MRLIQSVVLSPGRDLRELLALFAKHEVRHLVVGGFAMAAHGVPRTRDLDVWVACSTDNAEKIVAAIDEFGFASLGLAIGDFTQPDSEIRLGHEPNCVDILTGISGVRFDDVYSKRITATIDGMILPVIDRDSLIANKRAAGRAQDFADIAGLLQ